MPLLILDPADLEAGPAWDNAALLGAHVRLLVTAWRLGGRIHGSHSKLSEVTGLPPEQVGSHFFELTDGFELGADGWLRHRKMSRLLEKMHEQHGKELEDFALSAALATIAPDRFTPGVSSDGKKSVGKTALPKNFGYDEDLRVWAADNGLPSAKDQDWAMDTFINNTQARGARSSNWAADFKAWVAQSLAKGLRPPSSRGQGSSPFAALARPSKTDAARLSSAASLAAVKGQIFGAQGAAAQKGPVVIEAESPACAEIPRLAR